MLVKQKKFLVIGTAKSGIAATKYLLDHDAYVLLNDVEKREKLTKEILELERNKKLKGLFGIQPPLSVLVDIDAIIMSPGVPMDIPIVKAAKEQKIEVLSEVELAYRLNDSKIIAITGTNGKTTTTTLVGEMFKAGSKNSFVVGNIGVPMISQIETSGSEDWLIAEISSFQLEGIVDFKPDISAVLNITPDHLYRHKTMNNYINEKSKIFMNQSNHEITILNADDPIVSAFNTKAKSNVVFFSRKKALDQGIFLEEDVIYIKDHEKCINVCTTSDIKMLGDHNIENALAAIAISYYGKVPIENIRRVLREFKGVSHRIELVDTIDGIDFINDSKGTNPEASIKAIEAMNKPIILIAGGLNKGNDFTAFIKSFNNKVKYMIVFGETAGIIEETAKNYNFYNIKRVNNLDEAVKESKNLAQKGDAILLSPACASWDMYKSFEERGDHFKTLVRSLRR